MSRYLLVPAATLVLLVMGLPTASTAFAVQPINFTRGVLAGAGFGTSTR